ncbi:MAG TPA: hypothetical protein VN281_22140 [Verrucomicrobiae bacterium]|nr:hypothetical protein [Verrucomicrobiae bacterium]
MKARFVLLGIVVLCVIPAARLKAGQLLFESFENNYNRGVLDANWPQVNGGANPGTNGGPNPWWSPNPPSLRVVGTEMAVTTVVTPHSGTNMVRGIAPTNSVPDNDIDLYNIAYRLNNSIVFSGNILLDYWFYDPVGTNNAFWFQDYVSLAYFANVPTNADYPSDQSTGLELQGLSLGAGDPQAGADTNVYQAQVAGNPAGYDQNGWFNTTTPRSIGWHRGRISISPVQSNGIINVSFYIDDMNTATFTNVTEPGAGFNCIQLTADNGLASSYYDDLRFFYNPNVSTNATLNIATSGANAILTFPDLWQLQTSTNLGATNSWLTLPNATSPYTNSLGDAQRYFRLKSL